MTAPIPPVTPAWARLAAALRARWPRAELIRYGCPACLARLWRHALDRDAPACDCLPAPAAPPPVLPAGDADVVVLLDAPPAGYADAPEFPGVRFDALFGPACAYLLSDDPSARWVVFDPLGLAGTAECATARLLEPGLRLVRGGEIDVLFGPRPVRPAYPTEARDRLRSAALLDVRLRHAAANVIGPAVLAAGLPPAPPALSAPPAGTFTDDLQTVLRKLRLTPAPKAAPIAAAAAPAPAPWVDPESWAGEVDTFVLLDDMHANGWGPFLWGALGLGQRPDLAAPVVEAAGGRVVVRAAGAPAPRLVLCDRPERGFGPDGTADLLDRLRAARAEGRPLVLANPGRRYALNADGAAVSLAEPGGREVLFLDLRLFVTRRFDEELGFYRRALALAADPLFRLVSETAAADLGKYLDRMAAARGFDEAEPYYDLLTLLPRLVAAADPLLPVVVFSSTGQRHVSTVLGPFPSLVTTYDKPRFHGPMSDEIVAENAQRFRAAVAAAVDRARARGGMLELLAAAAAVAPAPVPPVGAVVEVYVDEAGHTDSKKGLSVGGFALFYRHADDPAEVDAELKARGLVWGVADGYPPAAPARSGDPPPTAFGRFLLKAAGEEELRQLPPYAPDPTNPLDAFNAAFAKTPGTLTDYYNAGFGAVQGVFARHGVGVVAFALSMKTPPTATAATALNDESVLDTRYRRMLGDVLEALLYDVLVPAAPAGAPARVKIDVGTRTWSREYPWDTPDAERRSTELIDAVVQWPKDFGLPPVYVERPEVSRKTKRLAIEVTIDLFRSDDFLPVAAEVVERRPALADRLQVGRARAVWLCDYANLLRVYGHFRKPNNPGDGYRKAVDQHPQPRPCQIHFLADWVVRRLHGRLAEAKQVDALLTAPRGGHTLRDTRNRAFRRWLAAARAAARGDVPTAVAEAITAWRADRGEQAVALLHGFARHWLPRAARWVRELDAAGVARVCEQLRRAP